MFEFIKSHGTLILAIYGVIQVWVFALWRKYARKGEIEIYETGSIIIGYSTFGPTIALNGTLRALNKSVFIKSIDLMVIKERDKSQHTFYWIAFSPPTIYLTGRQSILEIPSGFLISPDSPHRFNVLFNDSELFEDIQSLYNNYRSKWYQTAKNLNKLWPPSLGENPPDEILTQQDKLIEDFRDSAIGTDTFGTLKGKCYWEPGDYSLAMNIRTSHPNRVFAKNYRFSINKDDSKNLKLNVITMLEEPISVYLRIKNYPYHLAYSPYK